MFLRSNGVEIAGKVTKIHAKIEEINGKKGFFAEAQVENSGLDLLPNQTSINRIKLQTLENVLYVPNSAVLEEGGRFYVFTSGGVRQEVECKRANENYTQIINGLSKGQMIYLFASEGPSN
jgi:multidrug efflux pump subunit AcrA (membrane-fusion protein)